MMDETVTNTRAQSFELSSSLSSRFEGIIDIPFFSRMQSAFIDIFSYMDKNSPRMPFVYNLITFVRFMQILGPSFMISNPLVWNRNSIGFKLISIFSLVYHLVPQWARDGNQGMILIVLAGIQLAFFIFLLGTALYYKSTVRVPPVCNYIIALFMACFSFTLPVVSSEFMGELISMLIAKKEEANAFNIIALLLSFIVIFTYSWVLINCYNLTLTFRSSSFLSIEGSPQNTLFLSTLIYTFIIALEKDLRKEIQVALSIIAIIPSIIAIIKVFDSATFVSEMHQAFVCTGCFVACINILISFVPLFSDNKWDEVELILVFVYIILVGFVSLFFIKRRRMRNLTVLDNFEDTKDISTIGSVKKFKTLLSAGFTYCHPMCLDYSIFIAAATEWPTNMGVWGTYAKFAAIYPEKTATLAFIGQSIIKNGIKNKVADATTSQINDILKTREANLTPYLKTRIAKLSKTTTKTKNKLRNIWDLVLQGNINEIDSAIHAAQESSIENEFEVEHMISMFPNNRFAARVYSRFFLEIKADIVNHKIWKENVLSLQRGIAISADSIQTLALDAFPLLPTKVGETQNVGYGSVQGDDLTDDFTSEDKEDSNALLAGIIKSHKFRATKYIYITTLCLLFFFIITPSVILMVLFKDYQSEIEYPLNMMYGIARMRNIVNMITCFTTYTFAANIPEGSNPNITIMRKLEFQEGFYLTTFDNATDPVDITKNLIQRVPMINEMLNGVRSYKIGNPYLDKAREVLFETNTAFSVYYENGSKTDFIYSPETIATMIATQASTVVNNETMIKTADGMFSAAARTACNNNDRSGNSMSDALGFIVQFIMNNDKNFQKLYTIIGASLCSLLIVVVLIVYITQVIILNNQKTEMYKTFTTLPKTVLSAVSSSFYSIKKAKDTSSRLSENNSAIEMNKQEENAIKIFNSISNSSEQSSAIISGIIYIFITAAGFVSLFYIAKTYKDISTTLIESCPHIDYMLGAISYLFSILSKLMLVSLDQNVPSLMNRGLAEVDYEIGAMTSNLKKSVDYFHQLRFGGKDDREFPFVGMVEGLEYADQVMKCLDNLKAPKNFLDGAICYDSEGIYYLTIAFIKRYLSGIKIGRYVKPKGQDLSYVFQVGVVMQYEAFFFPCSEKVVNTISDDISSRFPILLKVSLSCIGVAIVMTFVLIYFVNNEDKYMRFTLGLLLHCPTKVIYSSQRIMALLNGESSNNKDDSTERDSDFFNSIIQKLNDIVIIYNGENNNIIDVNVAFEKTFGVSRNDLVGKNIADFLSSPKFTEINIEDVLSKTSELVFKEKDDLMYITTSAFNVNSQKVIVGRNITQRVMHQRLIDEEKKKSDSMLASILPPSLVPRVQAGEKNISFAVQSASVLFLDIVEFTPWCGSNQASYVMKMLNNIFKEMDACVASHKTLTRIKCIGDCYMAGGGIFDEVNQPAVHSKEMVEFGIEAIKKIVEIDEIYDEKLRIRVGINTGGPIIAGVLGTDKPTFEILGPTINIAQQMEHHGVPMMVHISRSVYELIYGGAFDIKERGEIEVKNGTMFTYLVDPKISKSETANKQEN